MTPYSQQARVIIRNHDAFARWWTLRETRRGLDRAIVTAAIEAGLIVKGSGLICLTIAGRELRNGLMKRRVA